MTPDPVAAVRGPAFDASLVMEARAICAACGITARARAGEAVSAPCGRRAARCAFSLRAAPPAREGHSLHATVTGARRTEEGDAGTWQLLVHRQALDPPPPPAGWAAFTERLAAITRMDPAMGQAAWCLPIGWFGWVELAAHALEARGLSGVLAHQQSKEKFGTARIHAGPAAGSRDTAAFRAADAILSWAVAGSGVTCARDGTLDGELVRLGGWWITLGARAWADAQAVRREGFTRLDPLNLYRFRGGGLDS